MNRTLQLGGLVLVCRGAPPPEGFRPLSPLFAKAKLRSALHDGGGPRLLAFAEKWLGVRRPRLATTLDLRAAAEEAVRRIAEALEFSSVLAFERPMAIPVAAGVCEEPEPEKKEREVFRSALVVTVVDEAGKPVPGADIARNAAGVGTTKNDGVHVLGTIEPGTYRIEAVKEGYRAATKSVQVAPEQTAQVQLELEKIAARLVWPAAGAAHKQYVNLDRDPSDKASGNVIQIQVGVAGGGKAGDRLYLEIDWDDAKVSKRNSPVRRVVGGATAGWCPKSGTTVTLKADGEEPIVEVDLGLAGGDEIKVSVGGTTACKDASCTITNWRRIWYELVYPDFMHLPGDLPAPIRARIDQLLLPNFIEYRLWKAHPFPESAALPGSVFPPAYFQPSLKRKEYVLTDYSFLKMPANVTLDGGKRPRSIALMLCDRCFQDSRVRDPYVEATLESKREKVSVYTGSFLPKSCDNGELDAIKEIGWVADIDPRKHPDHPAVHAGEARQGLLSLADVTYDDEFGFFLTLPDGTAADPGPGRLVGPIGPTTCPIKVGFMLDTAKEVNGLSMFSGTNAIVYRPQAPQVMGDTLVHELCHNAGMAAMSEAATPPGIPRQKRVDEKDPEEGTLGHLYTDHGHNGGHCARGLTDEEKRSRDYRDKQGTCVNFGAGPQHDPSPSKDLVCKTCSIILKGSELRNLYR